jgi:carbon monoxide dehydrogenase subunit G
MTMLRSLLVLVSLAFLVTGCGGSSGGTTGGQDAAVSDDAAVTDDTGVADDGPGDGTEDARRPPRDAPWPDPDGNFDPADPGYQMFFDLGTIFAVGTLIPVGVGGFWIRAREDSDPSDPPQLELDQCGLPSAPVQKCTSNDDCAPEQQCQPDTNAAGQAIAGSEHCQTPRTNVDVGPFTMTGFVGGPLEFSYQATNNGSYTIPGQGTISASLFAFDTEYTFSGEGDGALVGAYSGHIYMPVQLTLTAPTPITLPIGLVGLEIDSQADFALQWAGTSADEEVTITLAGGGGGGVAPSSITCRVRDDGDFTIPADVVKQITFSNTAMLNALTIERHRHGVAEGQGVTASRIDAKQVLTYNLKKL